MNVSPLVLTAKDDEPLGISNRSDAMGVLAVKNLAPDLDRRLVRPGRFA